MPVVEFYRSIRQLKLRPAINNEKFLECTINVLLPPQCIQYHFLRTRTVGCVEWNAA